MASLVCNIGILITISEGNCDTGYYKITVEFTRVYGCGGTFLPGLLDVKILVLMVIVQEPIYQYLGVSSFSALKIKKLYLYLGIQKYFFEDHHIELLIHMCHLPIYCFSAPELPSNICYAMNKGWTPWEQFFFTVSMKFSFLSRGHCKDLAEGRGPPVIGLQSQ